MKQVTEELYPQRGIFFKPWNELLRWQSERDLFLTLKFHWPCHLLLGPRYKVETVSAASNLTLKSSKSQTSCSDPSLSLWASLAAFSLTPFAADFSFLNEVEKHHYPVGQIDPGHWPRGFARSSFARLPKLATIFNLQSKALVMQATARDRLFKKF